MRDLIELHLFTNINDNIRSHTTILKTYNSFVEKFGECKSTIWLNPMPNTNKNDYEWYMMFLKEHFPNSKINITQSHAQGWIQAIETSTTPYVFMLEHDWRFTEAITHSIKEICEDMSLDNIIHYRFSKKIIKRLVNDHLGWGLESTEPDSGKNTKYFRTMSLSNLPCIIDKKLYTKFFIPMLKQANKNRVGRGGIEQNLMRIKEKMPEVKDYKFVIYGDSLDLPNTVSHLDARDSEKRIYYDDLGQTHENYI